MNPIADVLDTYERRARLYPALLLIAPLAVTGAVLLEVHASALKSFGAVIVSFGGLFLLSHLARDAGKRGEEKLFKRWGGLPSVTIFRHRDQRLDPVTKARYHSRLAALVKEAKAPSARAEEADPVAADRVYTAWSTFLRTLTRDSKKAPLVFKENVNYGFRRNVWGFRPAGILVSTACCIATVGRLYQLYRMTGTFDEKVAGTLALALVFLGLWLFRFTEDWVRLPADEYAKRLAESVDTL